MAPVQTKQLSCLYQSLLRSNYTKLTSQIMLCKHRSELQRIRHVLFVNKKTNVLAMNA